MTGKRTLPAMTHDEMVAKWMEDPAFKAEYDAIADEFAQLDEMLAARKEAGLTQAEVAERMGTKATAITRMESNLASGISGPSFSTLKKFARATGKNSRSASLNPTAPHSGGAPDKLSFPRTTGRGAVTKFTIGKRFTNGDTVNQ